MISRWSAGSPPLFAWTDLVCVCASASFCHTQTGCLNHYAIGLRCNQTSRHVRPFIAFCVRRLDIKNVSRLKSSGILRMLYCIYQPPSSVPPTAPQRFYSDSLIIYQNKYDDTSLHNSTVEIRWPIDLPVRQVPLT